MIFIYFIFKLFEKMADPNVANFYEAVYTTGDTKTIDRLFPLVEHKLDMLEHICEMAKFGNIDIVKCLHKNGVDINKFLYPRSSEAATPLIFAAIEGHVDIVDYLLPFVDINAVDFEDEWTVLMYACYYGQIDVVDRLLNVEGCDVNYRGYSEIIDESALSLAVEMGHHEIVDRLIVHGADIHFQDDDGNNLLHLAVQNGDLQMVNHIWLLGLDINQQNFDGDTPLTLASKLRLDEIEKLIIKFQD